MRPLLPADPASVGGHRLLGRLGSGGMGTVYLGRSPAGVLLAVKVIRADHAADPAFRARFRREAQAAAGLSGRWVVPVVAADPEAPEPWLATPFVPGPSLSEAVGAHGPLPAGSVRTLGVRLAEALEQVHAAGLVHRDVKPGNILLAPDGPRLIDFGIARAVGATTLTAADAVVGTPGYLPPEQARAGAGAPGPAGDVFSLGCVLVFAATGRGPFGGGHAAAVVFRTVHDEPVLDGVPAELREAVAACLAKDPAVRPLPLRLREALGGGTEPACGDGGSGADGADWLPPPLPRLIAERSTRALELPAPEPTRLDGPQAPSGVRGPGSGRLTRRRLLAVGGAVAAAAVPPAWLAARGRGPGGAAAARGAAVGPVFTVALQADLSGPGKAEGQAHERGLRLAADRHNARSGAPFRLAVRAADDGGDPARAAQVIGGLVADPSVVAVVGPTAQDAVPALAAACLAADLLLLPVSVHSGAAAQSDWRTVCDTRGKPEEISLPVLHYLSRVRPVSHTAVVEQEGAAETDWELTRMLRHTPPSQGTVSVHRIPGAAGAADLAGVVDAIVRAGAQAAVFAGTSAGVAGRFARTLAGAGFTGPRMATGRVMAPAFLEAAGGAAEEWVFGAFFTEPSAVPAAADFTAAHRAAYGAPPARWAAEAHDALGLVAAALAALGEEGRDRPGLSRRIFRTSYEGLAKPLAFDATTRTLAGLRVAHLYRVRSGAFAYLGPYADVTAAT
ncbi:bifunctional serine/threonine-protein kinase/ABC transporter substrate-binding protein [Streptomyces globosus]|uniref:bifunctional serine/threonine-protein kinase/ABC transporter substrate-binding protein n=2 Tax=Streptomyces globosus TaxID=68209 RepID=UPI00382C644C